MKRTSASLRARRLRIGYLPLTDAAPLVVAESRGIFKRHGLDVQLCREVGWATIREKLAHGELEAAATLAPMLWAMELGIGCAPCPVLTGFVLSAHGTALTVSKTLGTAAWEPAALRALARERRATRPLTFGVVFLFSSHHLLLRAWLRAAGVDPAADVRIVVVPPAQMYRNLSAGTIDGYAAGEPWNSLAIQEGAGVCPAWGAAASANPVEKVLAVTAHFARRRPDDHAALLQALAEAAPWCDDPAHRPEIADLLADGAYLNLPARYLRPALTGNFATGREEIFAPDFTVFHRGGINSPDTDKAAALQAALVAAGLLAAPAVAADLPARLFRPDLHPVSMKCVHP